MDQDKVRTKALNNAYMLLRIRPRSEREVRDRLRLKSYGPDLVDEIVEGLKKTGEIDDFKFASFWIESRMHLNPAGDVVLKHELKIKGVEAGVIVVRSAAAAGFLAGLGGASRGSRAHRGEQGGLGNPPLCASLLNPRLGLT